MGHQKIKISEELPTPVILGKNRPKTWVGSDRNPGSTLLGTSSGWGVSGFPTANERQNDERLLGHDLRNERDVPVSSVAFSLAMFIAWLADHCDAFDFRRMPGICCVTS